MVAPLARPAATYFQLILNQLIALKRFEPLTAQLRVKRKMSCRRVVVVYLGYGSPFPKAGANAATPCNPTF